MEAERVVAGLVEGMVADWAVEALVVAKVVEG